MTTFTNTTAAAPSASADLISPERLAMLPGGHCLISPVVRRPAYDIGYECVGGNVFVHVAVREWTAQIRRDFLRDADTLHEMLGQPVYALSALDDRLHHKFLAGCGFTPAGHATNSHGDLVQVFARVVGDAPVEWWEPLSKPAVAPQDGETN